MFERRYIFSNIIFFGIYDHKSTTCVKIVVELQSCQSIHQILVATKIGSSKNCAMAQNSWIRKYLQQIITLLMEEILHQLIDSLSARYLQGFMHHGFSRISSINSIIKINPWSRFLSNHFELPDFHKMPIVFSNWMFLREIIRPLHQQGMYHNAPAISRVLPLTAHPTHPTAPSNRNPTWNTSLRASASSTLVVPKRIPRLNWTCPLWKRRNVRPKPPIFWGFQQLVFGGVHGFRKGRWCSSSFQRAFGAPDEGFQSSYAQTINEPVATATTITIVIIEFCRDP